MKKREMTLDINGTEVKFTVDLHAHNAYINAMLPGNKVQPAHNFLMATCEPEKKEFLKEILTGDAGGFIAMQIAGHIDQEYTPQVQISIKKQ